MRDFVPVALITQAPLVLLANNNVPAKTAAELIALAKAKPGELAFGSYGIGSSNHLVAELLNTMAGISATHVPYRGSAPMMTDLIGGRIQFAFDGVTATLGYIPRRLGAPARGLHDQANAAASGRADDFQIGGAGLRRFGLVRLVRAGGNAEHGRRVAESQGQRGAGDARNQGRLPQGRQ